MKEEEEEKGGMVVARIAKVDMKSGRDVYGQSIRR